jgi:hypothetical protein
MMFFKEIFDVLWYLAYIAFIGVGAILYIASKFAKFLPTFGTYKLPAEIGGIILLVAGAWLGGGLHNEQAWNEKLRKANERAEKAEKNARQVNTEIKIEYRDRIRTVTETKEKIKTEIQIVREYIDRECKITDDAIRIHNEAALNKIKTVKETK